MPHHRTGLLLAALLLTACTTVPLPSEPVPAAPPPAETPAEPGPTATIHQVDLDGDSTPELVEWLDTVVTVKTQTGHELFRKDLGDKGAAAQTGAAVIHAPGEPPLLILTAAVRCRPATTGAHWLFRYTGAHLEPLTQSFPLCSAWRDLGGGRIELESYSGAILKRQTFEWMKSTLTLREGPDYSLVPPLLEPDTLDDALTMLIAHGPAIDGGSALFVDLTLYESFLTKTRDGAEWTLGDWSFKGCPATEPIRIPLLRNGTPTGALLLPAPCGNPAPKLQVYQIADEPPRTSSVKPPGRSHLLTQASTAIKPSQSKPRVHAG